MAASNRDKIEINSSLPEGVFFDFELVSVCQNEGFELLQIGLAFSDSCYELNFSNIREFCMSKPGGKIGINKEADFVRACTVNAVDMEGSQFFEMKMDIHMGLRIVFEYGVAYYGPLDEFRPWFELSGSSIDIQRFSGVGVPRLSAKEALDGIGSSSSS